LICRSTSSLPAYLEFCRCEARALLLDHRRAVELVADALLVHRTLSGRQIDVLIRAASGSPTLA
jgi:ATP-dependent Zn protease